MTLSSRLSDFATRVATETKQIRTLLNGNNPDLSALTTTAKTNLVEAINELNDLIDTLSNGENPTQFADLTDVELSSLVSGDMIRWNGTDWVNFTSTAFGRTLLALVDAADLTTALSAATTDAAGKVELATVAEVLGGTDSARAVTPAGVQAKIDSLVGAAPDLLNTLEELANALGENPNFATEITTMISGMQPKSEIGNPDTDFVSVFEAGLT